MSLADGGRFPFLTWETNEALQPLNLASSVTLVLLSKVKQFSFEFSDSCLTFFRERHLLWAETGLFFSFGLSLVAAAGLEPATRGL